MKNVLNQEEFDRCCKKYADLKASGTLEERQDFILWVTRAYGGKTVIKMVCSTSGNPVIVEKKA
jgi:hypothetical protein